MKQLALDIGLAPGPTLEGFFSGANAAAVAQLQQTLDDIAHGHRPPAPVYLWGEEGSGKSHLLKAVAHALQEQGAKAGWRDPSSRFALPFDEQWSAVLMDDVHVYSDMQQTVAFNWFINALSPANGVQRWVVATGTVPPADLPLREDLRTRFAWGHVFHLQPLDEAARRAVLAQEAKARGIALSADVVDYMLKRFSRDLGSLMELLAHLDRFALRTQRPITIPLLKTMLETE